MLEVEDIILTLDQQDDIGGRNSMEIICFIQYCILIQDS